MERDWIKKNLPEGIEIKDKKLYENENVVKVNTKELLDDLNFPEAINFTRKILKQDKNVYHHVGIYSYSAKSLLNFVNLPKSKNEISLNLEQYRAMDAGMSIGVVYVPEIPPSIDTKDDLILATITLKYTPSNSITISHNGIVLGVGAGQQNRVDCIKLAGRKADVWRLRRHPKVISLYSKFKEGIKRTDRTNAVTKYINGDFSDMELKQWKLKIYEDIINC